MTSLVGDERQRGTAQAARFPLLALGFRPFYLLAAIFAAAALPVWVVSYLANRPVGGYLSGAAWHSHEMLLGFAPAVIAGFLLTAVRNWTDRPTASGAALGALAALWVAGRVLASTEYAVAAAVIDAVFLPALALAIALPIWRSRNARNFKILAVVAGFALINAAYHLARLNLLPAAYMQVSIQTAVDLITILMAIVGGRVIPAFTANAVPGARPRRAMPVEIAAIGSLLLILAADVLSVRYSPAPELWISLLAVAALAHGIRLTLWDPLRTGRNALLAMLPVAYAWIPVALALRALAYAGAVQPTAAVHALTIGAMGGLMIAMMMRSALGHTGRPLAAGPVEIAAFVLVQAAALVRVAAGAAPPEIYREAIAAAGALWSLAFVVFLARYGAILIRPRIDGRPG